MLVSAEVRWFWEGQHAELHRWFASAPPAPGGGAERIDTYLRDPAQTELGIKRRGERPGLEVKALVQEGVVQRLGPLAAPLQIWTKISTTALGLDGLPSVVVHKRRWLRRYDTTGGIREIALGTDEQALSGESWPGRGCNVELTEVRRESQSRIWTTLGFEAFGSLDSIEASLQMVVRSYGSPPPPDVGPAHGMSYPQWLQK